MWIKVGVHWVNLAHVVRVEEISRDRMNCYGQVIMTQALRLHLTDGERVDCDFPFAIEVKACVEILRQQTNEVLRAQEGKDKVAA
jgi:hypothetical protein